MAEKYKPPTLEDFISTLHISLVYPLHGSPMLTKFLFSARISLLWWRVSRLRCTFLSYCGGFTFPARIYPIRRRGIRQHRRFVLFGHSTLTRSGSCPFRPEVNNLVQIINNSKKHGRPRMSWLSEMCAGQLCKLVGLHLHNVGRDHRQGRSEASNFGGVLGGLIYRLCQSIPTNIPEADPEPPPPSAHPQILHGSGTE